MNKNLLVLMLMGSSLVASGAYAQKVGNGGGEDVQFHKITSEVETWIVNNNNLGQLSAKLQLGSINSNDFLTNFSNAVNSTTLTFQDAPVIVAGQTRVCGNDINPNRIVCNREMWNQQTAGNLKYAIVLHEYLGVAGYEKNILNYSQYPISKNILDYVYEKNVFELGLEKRPNNSIDHHSDETNYFEKLKIKYSSGSKPEAANLLGVAWSGRCFFKNKPTTPHGAGFIFRQKNSTNVGPIENIEFEAAFDSKVNCDSDKSARYYDGFSFQALEREFKRLFLPAYFEKDGLLQYYGTVPHTFRVNDKYLIQQILSQQGEATIMCYYFNPELKN